jgi:ribosome-binding protein aMBF1 (putative translation factor)
MSQNIDRIRCDFCGNDTDGKLILKDTALRTCDGSDIVLCSECMNYYTNKEYSKINLSRWKKADVVKELIRKKKK